MPDVLVQNSDEVAFFDTVLDIGICLANEINARINLLLLLLSETRLVTLVSKDPIDLGLEDEVLLIDGLTNGQQVSQFLLAVAARFQKIRQEVILE